MLQSFAIIFIFGLCAGELFGKIRLPKIIAMLAVGIITGPFVLDLLDSSVLDISSQLRKIALIIILVKAGLSLNLSDLKKVGTPAILLSFLPASFEICAYVIFAPMFFDGLSRSEAALMGAVLSAVSPAVVVPRMVKMIDGKIGTEKGIPQMILAGASLDDVFVITLFGAFCTMVQGGDVSVKTFLGIPVSIVLGILLGVLCGFILFEAFSLSERKIKKDIVFKAVMLLAVSFLMISVEDMLDGIVSVSALLGVIAMAATFRILTLKGNADELKIQGLKDAFGKIWIPAECVLFVLVGAAVDINYTLSAGPGAIGLIFVCLAVRSVGTFVCVSTAKLTLREKLFCVVSYLPKATVQAAIGSVPLSLGLSCGNVILSVAVLGILITAPLGAFGMDIFISKMIKEKTNEE